MALPNVVGVHDTQTLKTGAKTRVVLLNNAATTPPFVGTLQEIDNFLPLYGTMHRGAGPHATITNQKVAAAIETIKKFINLPITHSLIFTQNTSGAINVFSRMLRLQAGEVVMTSAIEHTSNNLPWRYNTPATIVEVNAFDDGSIDYDDVSNKARKYSQSLQVIAMTGASNQTGYIPDIKKFSEVAHQHGALLFIDAAQLAPHRPIDMVRDGIDALAFSAHKMYAPFGLGVLALPTKFLESIPVNPGGGSIEMISDVAIVWSSVEERHQVGTWNVTGIIALAKSCEIIMKCGWDVIVNHEKELVAYTAEKLSHISGLTLYVSAQKYIRENRIGTFPFNLAGYPYALVSSILEHEYGIETRAGTICNHKLVRRWHHVSDQEQKIIEDNIRHGDHLASYGIVRASLGVHNTKQDINVLIDALRNIVLHGPRLEYNPIVNEGIYMPIDTHRYIP